MYLNLKHIPSIARSKTLSLKNPHNWINNIHYEDCVLWKLSKPCFHLKSTVWQRQFPFVKQIASWSRGITLTEWPFHFNLLVLCEASAKVIKIISCVSYKFNIKWRRCCTRNHTTVLLKWQKNHKPHILFLRYKSSIIFIETDLHFLNIKKEHRFCLQKRAPLRHTVFQRCAWIIPASCPQLNNISILSLITTGFKPMSRLQPLMGFGHLHSR